MKLRRAVLSRTSRKLVHHIAIISLPSGEDWQQINILFGAVTESRNPTLSLSFSLSLSQEAPFKNM
jgi:hypothetical protein